MTDDTDHTDDFDDTDDFAELSPEDQAYVSGLLAALPTVTMPADVAARIDAALAELPAFPDLPELPESPDVPAPAAVATVVPLDEHRAARALRRTRVLQVAAGVVLLAAGAVGVAKLAGGTSGGSVATTAGDAKAEVAQMTRSGHEYTDATLVSDVHALVDHRSLGAAAPNAVEATTPPATPSTGSPGVSAGSASASATASASRGPTFQLFSSAAVLRPCLATVQEGLADPVQPVALDQGVYRGQLVLVVVLPGSADPATTWDVFVVGADCGQGGDAHLLVYRLVPKR